MLKVENIFSVFQVAIIVSIISFVIWEASNWFDCRGKGGIYIQYQCVEATLLE